MGDAVDYVIARLGQHAAGIPVPMDSSDRSAGSQGALGWAFLDRRAPRAALIHRSYCAEHPDAVSNERLEFLGDAVLGLAVTDSRLHEYPELPEGELAKLRASVVNAEVLGRSWPSPSALGPALIARQGRGRVGRPRRSRRSWPTRWRP